MLGLVSIQEQSSLLRHAVRPEFFFHLLDHMADGVYFVDPGRRIHYWNQAAERISGYRADEVVGRRCADNILVHCDELGCEFCTAGCPLESTIADGQSREMEAYLKHKKGHRVPVWVRASPLLDANGCIVGGFEVFSDNTAKVAALEKARDYERQAMIDPLTGVGNRRLGTQFLARSLAAAKEAGEPVGVLLLDIDHFKKLNDTFGHDAGDAALEMVARTLRSALRPTDVVARWGGEEFVVIAPGADASTLAGIAARLVGLVRSGRMDWRGNWISVTVSAGGASGPAAAGAEPLLRLADQRMYAAKSQGRDRFVLESASHPSSLDMALVSRQ